MDRRIIGGRKKREPVVALLSEVLIDKTIWMDGLELMEVESKAECIHSENWVAILI